MNEFYTHVGLVYLNMWYMDQVSHDYWNIFCNIIFQSSIFRSLVTDDLRPIEIFKSNFIVFGKI